MGFFIWPAELESVILLESRETALFHQLFQVYKKSF